MKYVPLWHQAVTGALMDGKLQGKDRTAVFTVHSPVSGSRLRFRFGNLTGKTDTEIGAVSVVYGDNNYPVLFDGKEGVCIGKGKQIWSDPLALPVNKASDIGIRIYMKSFISDNNMIEENVNWLAGDRTKDTVITDQIKKPVIAKVLGAYNGMPALDLIEIETEEEVHAVVAFGDSITAMCRWTKPLSQRLEDEYHGKYILLNSGISGNCLLYRPDSIFAPVFGEPGKDRFQRDVLDLPDVSAVIIALGVNDVSYLNRKTKDMITFENYTSCITDMTKQLKERNIRVIMQTITPRLKCAWTMGIFTQEMEELRLSLNEWIRTCGIFDMVIDQEAVVRDQDKHGYFFREGLHQGDHLHPDAACGVMMAEAYDLQKLTGESR